MNHLCHLMGHDWSEWRWYTGCSDKWIPGKGSIGPVHSEEKHCKRVDCRTRETLRDLPGKFGGMDADQQRSHDEAVMRGDVKPY